MNQQAVSDRKTIAAKITEFAQDNGLKIHPGQDPLRWADLVVKNGGCPCVPGRTECPCEFVVEDVKKLNRCRCGLFVNAVYLREYYVLTAQRKSRKR